MKELEAIAKTHHFWNKDIFTVHEANYNSSIIKMLQDAYNLGQAQQSMPGEVERLKEALKGIGNSVVYMINHEHHTVINAGLLNHILETVNLALSAKQELKETELPTPPNK